MSERSLQVFLALNNVYIIVPYTYTHVCLCSHMCLLEIAVRRLLASFDVVFLDAANYRWHKSHVEIQRGLSHPFSACLSLI